MSEEKNKPTIAEELPLQEPGHSQPEAGREKGLTDKLRERAKKAKEAEKEASKEAEKEVAVSADENKIVKGNLTIEGMLIVRSPDKRNQITISPMANCAGIWINAEPDGDKYPRSVIAIYDDKDQGPVIGFYKDVGVQLSMTMALAMSESGPCIQVEDGRGGFGWVGLHELLDKHKPEWRQGPPQS